MKRTLFALLAAAAMVSQAVAADEESSRSVGAHPVVYDDYPESDVVLDIGPDIVLTVTGEARVRFEWLENTSDFSDNGFDGDDDDDDFDDNYSYAPARFNIGFRADLPRDVAAVIEIQSGLDLGGGVDGAATAHRFFVNHYMRPGSVNRSIFGDGVRQVHDLAGPGDFEHPGELAFEREHAQDENVYVYQGFIEAAHIGDSMFSVRFGRQELAYGTEWMLGNADFYDGQSFDGIKGIFEFSENARLDLFWAKIAERDLSGEDWNDEDADLYGAYFSHQSLAGSSIGLDAYVIGLLDRTEGHLEVDTTDLGGDDDADFVDVDFASDSDDGDFLSAWWAGVRLFREREHGFHFSAEGTYLFGDIEADVDGDDDEDLNLSAWGFEGHLGWTWDTPTNPTIRGGFTYASGTDADDYADGDYHTFFTPAGEVHPRLGLMDIVDASNVWAATIGYTGSFERHSWGVDLHHFEQAESDPLVSSELLDDAALADNQELDEELGQEIDLWYNYQYSEHMLAQFAVGYFNAGEFIEEINDCAGGDCDLDDDRDDIGTDDAWRVYANLLVRF